MLGRWVVGWVAGILLAAGCVFPSDHSSPRPGDHLVWEPTVVEEPLVVPAGSSLEVHGGLWTPGPITVRGSLVLIDADILFTGDPKDARLIVDGGEVRSEGGGMGGQAPGRIEITKGGRVQSHGGTYALAGIEVSGKSDLNMTDSTLQPVGSDVRLTALDSWARIEGTSLDAMPIVAEDGALIHLVECGVSLGNLLGNGTIELAWWLTIRSIDAASQRVPNATVVVSSAVSPNDVYHLTTDENGSARDDVVGIRRAGGTTAPVTPHSARAGQGPPVAFVMDKSQTVTLVTIE